MENLARALSAATGWDYALADAVRFGKRTAAILRAFNLRCGIGTDVEYPSERYGSQPVDGPAKEHNVMDAVGAHARRLVRDGRATTARPASPRKSCSSPSACHSS